jgi:8-oxo-dGTP pyrophosphatase MutT (NUDIX family)
MKKYGNFHKKPPVVKKSYGIACCRYNLKDKHMEILMVKKRYTFYYVEFIRGHYAPSDDTKILYLFNRISNEEKVEIESMNFDQMWYRVWRDIPTLDSNDYQWFAKCKRKFEMNFSSARDQMRLRQLLNQSTSTDCMWEIPKGRRDQDESELSCALRELREEADYDSNLCMILPETMELRTSNNKATYINKYFLALDRSNVFNDTKYKIRSKVAKLSFNDARQISEIIDVRWMSLVEVKFLDQTNQFARLIGNIFKLLRSRYKISKLTELALL